jgi:integrase
MSREVNKLSWAGVKAETRVGRHSDGGGLYLVVDPSGAKRWVFLFRWGGKLKEMGLGGIDSVKLAPARLAAEDARRLVAAGKNPIDERKREKAKAGRTFGDVADDLLASLEGQWTNAKHRTQWYASLTHVAAPLRPLPVDQITTEDVLGVLKPIWPTIPETASRTRGRIERVLDAAKAKGFRTGENPARWKGHLAMLLPARQRLTKGHHPSMPWADVPAFMAELRERPSSTAYALEFLILTAARNTEVTDARWSEIDLEAKLWTVPAERMKAKIEHRVPLSDAAIAVLKKAGEGSNCPPDSLVFAGARKGRPLSNMTMTMLLRRMKREAYSVHGFRSSFRDWAGDSTSFAREVAEAALAHVVGEAVERAYRRGDALEKRRKLMVAWAGFLGRVPASRANVHDIRGAA